MDRDRSQIPLGPSSTRRGLLALTTFVGAGGLLAAGAGMVGGFLSNSLGAEKEGREIKLGKLGDVRSEFRRRVLSVTSREFWKENTRNHVVYVRKNENAEIIALSAECSHMGCAVKWEKEAKRFACPCHEGYFDVEGVVLSGPPPAGLKHLETRVDDGLVFVKLAART